MEKKTIAINALSALQGGGQVYLSNILHYADKFPDIKIYVFAPLQFASLYSFPGIEVITVDFTSKNLLARMLWEKWQLPKLLRQLQIDLVFCPGGSINFSPPPDCLTAVTFQNMLIFNRDHRQRYPLGYKRARLAILERMSKQSFRKADLVIFLSDYARKIIDNQIPDRNGLSVTIPHGLNDKFRNAGGNDLPRLNLIPEGEYLLYVSIIDIYKAQFEVVQAYHKLCQKRPTKEKLVLVGPTHYSKYEQFLKSEINRLKLEDKVFLIGNIPYSLMPSLYHNAKAHIFASACENCPNIVLESLGSGQPLFLSNKPPMPEIAGDAAVYFDPNNPDELAGLLLRYLNDDKWIVQMGKRAYQKSLEYNWEKTARETFQEMLKLNVGNLI